MGSAELQPQAVRLFLRFLHRHQRKQPLFQRERFQLNSESVDNGEETLLDGPDAMRRPRGGFGGMRGGSLTSNAEEVRSSVEYRQYEEMGLEIRDALLRVLAAGTG